jgi:hypothetical protein
MYTFFTFIKKFVLVFTILAIGLVAFPAVSVSAADFQDETTPPASQPSKTERLERIWARAQTVFQRQGFLLARADEFLSRAQILIDKANQKGWDTSAVQTALDAFAAVIPAAEAAHAPGAAIIASHNGFNSGGNVTDRAAAIETVKALVQVLKDTRASMDGTGQALRVAVKALRDAHRPELAPGNP